jgi:hypothetical protein
MQIVQNKVDSDVWQILIYQQFRLETIVVKIWND